MYIAEICTHSVNDGWVPQQHIRFANGKRFLTFMRYYTRKNPDIIIRAYCDTFWFETFKNGADIWNCW